MSAPAEGAQRSAWRDLASGVAAVAGAALVAWLAHGLQSGVAGNEERAVAQTGVLFAALGMVLLAAWAVVRRRALTPAELVLAACTAAALLLTGSWLFWASASTFQRADILLWSESPFVQDIIKFRTGQPLYSAPADLDSFYYTPGSQLLTYALAKLAGAATSVPAYRVIQLLYVAAAALLTARTARRIAELAGLAPRGEPAALWAALWALLGVLAGGNLLTNPFTHLLHNDALSLVAACATFLLLLEYAATRRPWLLVALAVMPSAGFAVKQSLAAWAGLITGYLVVFDRPRSLPRAALYAAGSFGLLALTYGAGRLLWGADFHYWTVTGLGNHPVSLLRSVQHVLDAWAYFAVGIAAGALLLRPRSGDRLLGPWVVWLLFFAAEAYTSGVAWMLNHLGPGSVLAMAWFGAALVRVWPRGEDGTWRTPASWLRPAAVGASTVLLFSGLGAVHIPTPSLPPDIERYTAAIEREAAGQDLRRVLIDHGAWLGLPGGIVIKDRMAAAGEAGWTGTGDFSGLLDRVRTRYYQRILVHDLDAPGFQYDYHAWRRPSGIRAALHEHYTVVRTIEGVQGLTSPWFRTISVLEPRSP